MRKLKASDIKPFISILKKMNLRDIAKRMFNPDKKNEDGSMVAELVVGIVENFDKAEKDFFTFVGDLQDEKKTAHEIADLDLDVFIEMIQEIFSEKNLPFFKSASKIIS